MVAGLLLLERISGHMKTVYITAGCGVYGRNMTSEGEESSHTLPAPTQEDVVG